jgi:hypothetical protein
MRAREPDVEGYVDVLGRPAWRRVRPEHVGDPVHRDQVGALDREQRQEGTRLAAAHLDRGDRLTRTVHHERAHQPQPTPP